MLLQFTVGNYRSFREKVTFSLMAAPQEPGHEKSLIPITGGGCALSLAALYGANASGKSNLLRAIDCLRRIVVYGTRLNEPLPIDRFLLNTTATTIPSFFEVYFQWRGQIYAYGIECDVRTIHREWLRNGPKDITLFERTTKQDTTHVKVSHRLEVLSDVSSERWQFIAEGTRSNQPFITQAITQNITPLRELAEWFLWGLRIQPYSTDDTSFQVADLSQENAEYLGIFLRTIDTGITGVSVIGEDFDISTLPPDRRRYIENIVDLHPSVGIRFSFSPDEYSNERRLIVRKELGSLRFTRMSLRALHSAETGNSVPMDWSSESDGTRRMAELWQMIFIQPTEGMTLFIDEIERSLHPELMRVLLDQWRTSRPENSQLIFTTHNDNLLEDDLLRRDEVWFVEKDRRGGSQLKSEVEFKSIPGVSRQRAYLDGMYGGVPRLPARRFHWIDRTNANANGAHSPNGETPSSTATEDSVESGTEAK